jgi:hypothetical protein
MVTSLSQALITAGATLVQQLDQAGAQPDAAFWHYDRESNTWKLVLVEAKVFDEGPKVAYRQVQKILSRLTPDQRQELSLEDIELAKPDSMLVRLLRAVFKTGAGSIAGIQFKNSVINGQSVDDAYIYRLT